MRRMGRRRFEIRAFGFVRLSKNISASHAGGTRHVSKVVCRGAMSVQYPGRVFQISSDGDDRMEAKIKTQKISWTKS